MGDTNKNENETLEELKKAIEIARPGPHAFIISLAVKRFTNEEKQSIEMLSKYFGL